jgi:phytoene dehydrogenase-like protein
LLNPRDVLAWLQDEPRFTGDDFETAHRLLVDPRVTLSTGAPEIHPERHDVIVVGGGVSGLTVAYRLRDRDVLLLEREPQPGGVAKSETWQGLEYSIGAAYIIDPDPRSTDPREQAGFALLEELGLRGRGEDLATDRSRLRRQGSEAHHCFFSNRRVVPGAEVYSPRNRAFFEHVLDSDRYPSVPPTDPTLVEALDRVSFKRFLRDPAVQRKLYARTAGPFSRIGWEAVEYYCWGAFGTTADETSAYHGLNFLAAEFGPTLVFPGGNGFITRRLAERITRAGPRAIKTGAWTLRIEREAGGFGVITWEHGTLHRHLARAVVFAAPLFLAPLIVAGLPDAQRNAISSLGYRSYVVANVLLKRRVDRIFTDPALRGGYELTRVHGIDVDHAAAEELSGRKVFSDAVVADFAIGRDASHAVLTVYRPYPYSSGRTDLIGREYRALEEEVRREVLAGFGAHGLKAADIEGIRLTRWGHPMIVARPGQLADGALGTASQPQPGLYFAHTDVQGAPAYENAIASAHDAVEAIRKHLT